MQKTLIKSAIKRHVITVSILRDYKDRFIVRKSEVVYGIIVPFYETYALDLPDAYKIQQDIINELNNFQLN